MELFDVYTIFDVEPVNARGAMVIDKNGTKYLDFYGGHAVISIGHSHPYFIKKIKKQLKKLAFYSNSVENPLQEKLAKKLGEISGYGEYKLFLCNSGAEANENALKLASFYNKKKKIIALKKAFHGRTSGAVAITDNPKIKAAINPDSHVTFVEINNHKNLEKAFTQEICAVMIEGIQGVAGINEPTADYMKKIRELCKKNNAVFICDEVQSGYGRTGKFFAHQHHGVTPDMITTAKGMGNGFPVAGLLLHPKFKPQKGMLGTTFGGNHLACAAGIAVLDVLKKEKLIKNAEKLGEYLKKQLLAETPQIRSVKGKGLLLGIEFEFPVAELRKKLLFNHQIFTGSASDKNILRILPPLSVTQKECNIFVEKLKLVL